MYKDHILCFRPLHPKHPTLVIVSKSVNLRNANVLIMSALINANDVIKYADQEKKLEKDQRISTRLLSPCFRALIEMRCDSF